MTVSGLMLSIAAGGRVCGHGPSQLFLDCSVGQHHALNPTSVTSSSMPSPRVELRTRRFPAAMATELAALPGVREVQMFRSGRITFR
jgi:hypothetical protein